MMSRRHGPLVLVVAPLLLLLDGALAGESKVDQRRQDFSTNFRGPPLGENGFVGENPLPRPQGVVDLGTIGDGLPLGDIFREVDQTFNIDNQLTNEAGTFQPSFPSNALNNDISSFSVSQGFSGNSEGGLTDTNGFIETSGFSIRPGSSENSEGGPVDNNGFIETSGFQVFHDPGTEASVNTGSENLFTPEIHDDVLTITFEEHQQPFPPPVIRGNRRPGRPGRPNRRPLRPLRRPIRQPLNGRPRLPNKPRRDQPGILSLLTG